MLKGWGLSAPAYHPHPAVWAAQAPPGPKGGPPPRCFYFPPLWAQTWGGANQAFCSTTVAGGGAASWLGRNRVPEHQQICNSDVGQTGGWAMA